MAISADKTKVLIYMTKEQAEESANIAKELGISRSALAQLAVAQYINAYKQSKGVLSDVLKDSLSKSLEGKEIDVEQVEKKVVMTPKLCFKESDNAKR